MRNILCTIIVLTAFGCKPPEKEMPGNSSSKSYPIPELNLKQAENLASLPLACAQKEYPNKLNDVLGEANDLAEPSDLHPAFYGCFDWHSSVHGHWSMVNLLHRFPDIKQADEMKRILKEHLTEERITKEIAYFHGKHNKSWERTYGWAWLMKLDEMLYIWDDPLADELSKNLEPLTLLLEERFMEFLPKLVYPIRVGEHPNTAFGLSFALDYARTKKRTAFEQLITSRAMDFYKDDAACPFSWEPGGFDFLSPCLEEAALMSKILTGKEREKWLRDFMPELFDMDFDLEVAKVGDRTDGKLVHLDGVNFSRAWNLYEISSRVDINNEALINIANKHVEASLPSIVGDSYEGGHWLGSFALYALGASQL
jgi:hypothetical protein